MRFAECAEKEWEIFEKKSENDDQNTFFFWLLLFWKLRTSDFGGIPHVWIMKIHLNHEKIVFFSRSRSFFSFFFSFTIFRFFILSRIFDETWSIGRVALEVDLVYRRLLNSSGVSNSGASSLSCCSVVVTLRFVEGWVAVEDSAKRSS